METQLRIKRKKKNASSPCQRPISQDEIRDSWGRNKIATANNPSQAISRKYLFLKACSVSSHFRKTKRRPWGADKQAPKRHAARTLTAAARSPVASQRFSSEKCESPVTDGAQIQSYHQRAAQQSANFHISKDLLGPQLLSLNGNCQTGFCANMRFPWGQTFWVYNLFFHFPSFLSMATTSKMREAGGEGCRGHQRTEQIQSAGRANWITRRCNAARASLLCPWLSITDKWQGWVHVGRELPPSAAPAWMPQSVLAVSLQMIYKVVEREMTWQNMQKKKEIAVEGPYANSESTIPIFPYE